MQMRLPFKSSQNKTYASRGESGGHPGFLCTARYECNGDDRAALSARGRMSMKRNTRMTRIGIISLRKDSFGVRVTVNKTFPQIYSEQVIPPVALYLCVFSACLYLSPFSSSSARKASKLIYSITEIARDMQ